MRPRTRPLLFTLTACPRETHETQRSSLVCEDSHILLLKACNSMTPAILTSVDPVDRGKIHTNEWCNWTAHVFAKSAQTRSVMQPLVSLHVYTYESSYIDERRSQNASRFYRNTQCVSNHKKRMQKMIIRPDPTDCLSTSPRACLHLMALFIYLNVTTSSHPASMVPFPPVLCLSVVSEILFLYDLQ